MTLKKKNINNPVHLINENIPFSEVLLIEENKKKIISIEEALKKANDNELDLVCLSIKSKPPVCKLLDYKKFSFETKKKNRNKEKKIIKKVDKKINISFNIDNNHLENKLRHSLILLDKCSSIIFNLNMFGKEKAHPELAYDKCKQILSYLESLDEKIKIKSDIHKMENRNFSFSIYKKKQ